jgi:hypothetical protein
MLGLEVPDILVGHIEFGVEFGDEVETIASTHKGKMHDDVKYGDARGQTDQEAFDAVHGSGVLGWETRIR